MNVNANVPVVDELLIRIRRGPIECTRIRNGQKEKKILSVQQVVSLMSHMETNEKVEDELVDVELPEYTYRFVQLDGGTRLYGLYIPAQQVTYNYHGTPYPQTPFPPLVFFLMVHEGSLKKTACVAVTCERKELNGNTPIFQYPYGNVYSSSELCWGSIPKPEVSDVSMIGAVPRIFINGEHNDHGYNMQNQGAQREFLQRIQGKDFPLDTLKPHQATLGQWWKKWAK